MKNRPHRLLILLGLLAALGVVAWCVSWRPDFPPPVDREVFGEVKGPFPPEDPFAGRFTVMRRLRPGPARPGWVVSRIDTRERVADLPLPDGFVPSRGDVSADGGTAFLAGEGRVVALDVKSREPRLDRQIRGDPPLFLSPRGRWLGIVTSEPGSLPGEATLVRVDAPEKEVAVPACDLPLLAFDRAEDAVGVLFPEGGAYDLATGKRIPFAGELVGGGESVFGLVSRTEDVDAFTTTAHLVRSGFAKTFELRGAAMPGHAVSRNGRWLALRLEREPTRSILDRIRGRAAEGRRALVVIDLRDGAIVLSEPLAGWSATIRWDGETVIVESSGDARGWAPR